LNRLRRSCGCLGLGLGQGGLERLLRLGGLGFLLLLLNLRLLASLAEHHAAPPPEYEDSLSDLSPYHWQRVVSDRRCERASLMRSSAEMVWEAGP
jgi:hypothetical protein